MRVPGRHAAFQKPISDRVWLVAEPLTDAGERVALFVEVHHLIDFRVSGGAAPNPYTAPSEQKTKSHVTDPERCRGFSERGPGEVLSFGISKLRLGQLDTLSRVFPRPLAFDMVKCAQLMMYA